MKFGIDIGHNCPPQDVGASGIRREDVLTQDVGTRLMAKLAAAGHSVVPCKPTTAVSVNDSLQKRVNKANSNNVDVFVSIHFNAAFSTNRPMGSEVYAISNISKEAIKVGLIGDVEDNSTPNPATLRITQKTILKPSTRQSLDLDPASLVDIDAGDYPVLDFRREERHFWVKWPDKSKAGRDEHFIFEEYAEIIE